MDRLSDLEQEKKSLLDQKEQLEYELKKPSIKEISLEQLQNILNGFSKILPHVAPDKQKDLLHTIINKITVNEGNSPTERSVKDIELYFDASKKIITMCLLMVRFSVISVSAILLTIVLLKLFSPFL